jgi:hypothetical protein
MPAAVGTATIVEETFGSVKLIGWSWIGGTAETTLTGVTTTAFYSGQCRFFVTVPGTSDAPADDYDVKILDKNDVDILANAGVDRDATSVETVLAGSLGCVANSQLELVVTGSGSSGVANGVVYLWLR